MRFAVGVAGAVVAALLIVAVAVAALLPVDACACATPLDLTIVNLSRQETTVHWNQPGVFGTPIRGLDGGVVVPACSTVPLGLRSGIVHVSVRIGGSSREFDIHVRDVVSSEASVIWVRWDGSISDPGPGLPLGGWQAPGAAC